MVRITAHFLGIIQNIIWILTYLPFRSLNEDKSNTRGAWLFWYRKLYQNDNQVTISFDLSHRNFFRVFCFKKMRLKVGFQQLFFVCFNFLKNCHTGKYKIRKFKTIITFSLLFELQYCWRSVFLLSFGVQNLLKIIKDTSYLGNDLKTLLPIQSTQVLVQTQIELWSDTIERTPLCSQAEITGSWKAVRAHNSLDYSIVWTSDYGLIRGQFRLNGLIIVFIVWTMVWVRSDQRSIRPGRSDFECIIFSNFLFFIEGCWLCQEATIKQRSDQRLI